MEYAENVSFVFDVKILFHTVYSVLARKNINAKEPVVAKEEAKIGE